VTKGTKERVLRELVNTAWLQEFRRKLYVKAKAEPKFRFYSLYDKTYRMDVLAEAWRKVKANGGTSGIDGETCEVIEEQGLDGYLAELQLEMQQERYQPQAVKRVYIPKANGKKRPLGIPTIRDRIVQTAFLLVLEPIFEADFAETSYGFRPEKSAHDAVREIYKYLNWGCEEVYDVDLEKYFDTVEHHKLMKLIARRIVDKQILHVIKLWLGCGYVEDGEHKQSKRGTPQGGVISPLLANIYLNPVDQAFKRNGLGAIRNGSIHLIRYADDMLVLAQRELETGINLLERYVERLGLRLNPEDAGAENGTTSERGLPWVSILSGQEQENREAVGIGITKSYKSAAMSGESAKTHTPLDSAAGEGSGSERKSVFAWLGRILSPWK